MSCHTYISLFVKISFVKLWISKNHCGNSAIIMGNVMYVLCIYQNGFILKSQCVFVPVSFCFMFSEGWGRGGFVRHETALFYYAPLAYNLQARQEIIFH